MKVTQETILLDRAAQACLDRLARLASGALHAPVAFVVLVEGDIQDVRGHVALPGRPAARSWKPFAEGLCRQVLLRREPLAVEDVRSQSWFPAARDDLAFGAYLGVPLITPDQDVLGSLCVLHQEPHAWTEEEVGLAKDLTTSAVAEIALRLKLRAVEERTRMDAALREVTRVLGTAGGIDEAVQAVVRGAVESTRAVGAYLELAEAGEGQDQVEVIAAAGEGVPVPGTRVPYKGSVTAKVAELDRTELAIEQGTIGDSMPSYLGQDWAGCAGLMVPLSSGEQVLGALVLRCGPGDEPLWMHETAFARALGDAAAAALRRILLLRDLRRSERRLRELAENVRAVFWIATPDFGRFLYVSPLCEQIWGRTVEDIQENPGAFMRLVHPEDRDEVRVGMERLTREKEVTMEYRILRPDGQTRWIRVRGFQVPGEGGEPYHLVGVSEDVTERKRRDDQVRLLAESMRVLDASLDYEETLGSVARFIVRGVADWSAIYVPEGDGIRRAALAAKDAEDERLLREMDRRHRPTATHPAAEVIRTRKSLLFPEVPPALLERMAHDEEKREALRGLRIRSLIYAPLLARGRVLGVIGCGTSESGRTYGPAELAFAEELALRAALALDNAKLYEEAEAASARVTSILERIKDAFYALDGEWRFTYVNRRAEELLRRSREELLGKVAWEVFPEAVGTRVQHEHFRAREEQTSITYEDFHQGVWIETNLYPSEEGLSVFFRIIEWKQAEVERERLLEAESRARSEAERRAREEAALRGAVETLSGTLSVEEAVSAIAEGAAQAMRAATAFIERLDIEHGDVEIIATAGAWAPRAGTRFPAPGSAAELVVEFGRPMVIDRLSDAERPFAGSPGEDLPEGSVVAMPLEDGGEILGVLFVVRDPEAEPFGPADLSLANTYVRLAVLAFRRVSLLQESELAREEIRRLMEGRARLMRGFSHDVKNPLGAADGHLQLLRDGVLGDLPESQETSVWRAQRSVRRALDLIEDLLDFARTETEHIKVDWKPTEVRAVVLETVDEYRVKAEAKGLTVEAEIPERVPVIRSDAIRIHQILSNLLSNAVKYTSTGAVRVQVRTQDRGDGSHSGRWVAVDVSDTGPGISEEDQELLFQEFVRLGAQEEAGMGVGLAISRRIADALGGEILVESEPGRGSTFTLRLPADRRRSWMRVPWRAGEPAMRRRATDAREGAG